MTEQSKRFMVLAGIIVLVIFSRLLPHPANFTPLAAIALFGGAYFLDRKWGLLVPILALLISDVLLHVLFLTGVREYAGLYPNMAFVYGSIALVVLIGRRVGRNINVASVFGGAVAASLLFFIISNFGAWLTLPAYPKTFAGLIEAYVAGIPFYRGTLFGDLVYSAVVFGVFELILIGRPQWRLARS